jgi:phage RecT family recombinase
MTAQSEVTTRIHPIVQFENFLEQRKERYKKTLPAHISPERFIKIITNAALQNSEILACDRESLAMAILKAAAQGLMPDGVEGAIVPMGKRAQWLPMYQGLLKLFRNSGEYLWCGADIVYEGDEWDHWTDENGPHFTHRKAHDRNEKKVLWVYAAATTKSGGKFIAALTENEIEKHRKQSRTTRDDSPWNKWWEAMAKKTAIIVLAKMLPKSSDIEEFMQEEEREALDVQLPEQRRQVTAVDAMDQFASAPQREGQSTGESAAIVESATEDGAARDSAPSQEEDIPPKAHFETPLEYFEYAQAVIDKLIANNEDGLKQARLWFNSEFQRKLRREHAISVEEVVKFHEKIFGK